MTAFVSRIWQAFSPPNLPKRDDAPKFGTLGAASIAPLALIIPAKSHPEVIIQAVSDRNRQDAEAFAKKHGIPEVRDSFQEILDDPNIACVYIALPNSLHYEWAVRAISACKNVLLEKPSVSNSTKAELLFNLPELLSQQPNAPAPAPVLLEAFHNRSFPPWALFRSLIRPGDVARVYADCMIPWWGIRKNTSINFNYGLGGGAMMGVGTYNFAALRMAFGAEPLECLNCDAEAYTDGMHDKCDWAAEATFRFPNSGISEAQVRMKSPTIWKPSSVAVTSREVVIPDSSLPDTQEKVQLRKLTLHGFIHGICLAPDRHQGRL